MVRYPFVIDSMRLRYDTFASKAAPRAFIWLPPRCTVIILNSFFFFIHFAFQYIVAPNCPLRVCFTNDVVYAVQCSSMFIMCCVRCVCMCTMYVYHRNCPICTFHPLRSSIVFVLFFFALFLLPIFQCSHTISIIVNST